MKESSFFALAFRQKYIERWQLMRSTIPDSLSTHVSEVAMLTHALAELGNRMCSKHHDVGRAVLLALYHDLPEVLTGDLPTPVKYFSAGTKETYSALEAHAVAELVSKLPDKLQAAFADLLAPQAEAEGDLLVLVKAADKLAALIKCMEEEKSGNTEFLRAKAETERALTAMQLPEVSLFCELFLPAFAKTIDEL